MSETKDSFTTKSCACLTPLSTAGVSEYTVSVAASCRLGTLRAGFLDLSCFFIGKVPIDPPHCVVWLKVSLMVSSLTQPQYGLYLSKSGISGLILCSQACMGDLDEDMAMEGDCCTPDRDDN